MSTNNPTFEEVDRHIESADLSLFQPGGKHHVASGTTAAAAMPQLCPIYKTVRPVLVLISNLPLIPQKWKDAIKLFLQFLDVLCP